jgi:cell division septation protein DedD
LGRLVALVGVGFALGLTFGLVTEEPELLARHLRGESESVDLEVAQFDPGKGAGSTSIESPSTLALNEFKNDVEVGLSSADEEARGPDSASDDSAVADAWTLRPSDTKLESGRSLPAVASRPARASGSVIPVTAMVPLPESAKAALRNPTSASPSRQQDEWSIQIGAFSDQIAAERLAGGLRDRYPVAILPASRKGGRWRVRVQPFSGESDAQETAERLKSEEGLPTWVTKLEGRSGS